MKYIQNLAGKHFEKRARERSWSVWDDNIKIHVSETDVTT